MASKIKTVSTASLLLRLGLAFVFLYAAISSLRQPLAWTSYLPTLLTKHIRATLLLKIFSGYELVLSAWLLSGKYTQYAAAVCALTLAGIVISSPGQLLITFRDIGLVFMAASLFMLEK